MEFGMRDRLPIILTLVFLLTTLKLLPSKEVLAQPLIQEAGASSQLIEAVNELRLTYGLPPLNVHPVLMKVAQIEAEGLAAGRPAHWRPNNLTLGQWLLSLGYPLSGDLSLDGYRSENVVWGPDFTVQDAIRMWNSDIPHTNTMLSSERSDIGAGISTGTDEWGQTVYYYVLETALQTDSGQMQYESYSLLKAIAIDQGAAYGDPTQIAQSLQVSQYIMPVVRATARPDGDVIHEVKNGQSMWSIAIEYGGKIDQIQRLNNLSSTDLYSGQKLLVQKGATQPAPMPTATVTALSVSLSPTPTAEPPSPLTSAVTVTKRSLTVTPTTSTAPPEKASIAGMAVGTIFLALLLAGLFTFLAAQRSA